MTNLEFNELGLAPGGCFAGRYEVVRRLGSGGMAVVFEALDISLNRERVALKVFSPSKSEDDKALMSRFRNEVVITRRLTHPNIVRTYDFAELPNGLAYMTMEFVDGSSLDQLLKSTPGGRLDVETAYRVISETAEAIQYAHQHGVIHRDLKPGNVLISIQGQVKVTDFGLAQSLETRERLTMTGECVGTPAYMSPEQVLGKPADQRSDIYALGMIAYEIATGKIPFRKKGWFELANQIVNEPIPPFANDDQEIPAWYESVVLKATEKEPNDRFESAKALIEAVAERMVLDKEIPSALDCPPAFWSSSNLETTVERSLGKPLTVHSVSKVSEIPSRIQVSFSVPARAPLWTAVVAILFLISTIGVKDYLSSEPSPEQPRIVSPSRDLKGQSFQPDQSHRALMASSQDGVRIDKSLLETEVGEILESVESGPIGQLLTDGLREARRETPQGQSVPPWLVRQRMREQVLRGRNTKLNQNSNRSVPPLDPADIPRGYRSIR